MEGQRSSKAFCIGSSPISCTSGVRIKRTFEMVKHTGKYLIKVNLVVDRKWKSFDSDTNSLHTVFYIT